MYSVYTSPGPDLPASQLTELLQQDTPTLIAGNLNAKHANWNSKTPNTRGSKLNKLLKKQGAIAIGPPEDTHINLATNSTDVLDIAIIKNVKWT